MKSKLKLFMSDSLVGKICILGIVAPLIAGGIRYYISQVNEQDFYILTGYLPWEIKLYQISFIWFCVAAFWLFITRRCPNCKSSNNYKVGKREVGRIEGVVTETIKVDENIITGTPKYESYEVATTFAKIEFSYNCRNCSHNWNVIREIPVTKPSSLKETFIKFFSR